MRIINSQGRFVRNMLAEGEMLREFSFESVRPRYWKGGPMGLQTLVGCY